MNLENFKNYSLNTPNEIMLTIEADDLKVINSHYNYWLNLGFSLFNKYAERKYIFFGAKTYFITMQKVGEPIEVQIHDAIKEERYEDVMKLREIKDQVHELKF